MLQLFHNSSEDCSRVVTKIYSTSFASAIRLLHQDLQAPIYNIYGFVRLADEIVDSFHDHDKSLLLARFKSDTYDAIERGISLNPILHSFQRTLNQYDISPALVESFFRSMEMDLFMKDYDRSSYEDYIYGSAESVGLMCLTVFCERDTSLYEELRSSAQSLGAAFQKVNFLRDIKADHFGLSRTYFPGCDFTNFIEADKIRIENEIRADFANAYEGILKLPLKARFGVYVAYKYYYSLFKKIERLKPEKVLAQRIRIPDYYKAMIIVRAGLKNQLRLI